MKDLISRKAAKEMFAEVPFPIAMTGNCCAAMLDDLPSVEAEPSRSGGLNYEAELAKAKEEICKLREENKWLSEEKACMEDNRKYLEREHMILNAQMDVVRMIFGGRNG